MTNKQIGRQDYFSGVGQHPTNIDRRAGWLSAAIDDPRSIMNKSDKEMEALPLPAKPKFKVKKIKKQKRPMGRRGERRKLTEAEILERKIKTMPWGTKCQ